VGPSDSMLPEGYEVVAVLGGLSQIRRSLEDGRFDKWPVAFWALGHELPIFARDWDGLLYATEHIILTCERIYDHMTGTQSRIEDWRDFQSPEFSELIEAITSRKEGSGRNVLTK
jgi:hypothetical protein